jgi:hypothetical protein
MSTELTKMIDDLVEQKTFTLDGLKAVQELREQAIALTEKNRNNEDVLKGTKADLQARNNELVKANAELAKFKDMETALVEREKKQTKLECDVEKHKALAEQGKEFVQLIFRNQTVMTSTMKHIPIAGSNGCAGFPVQVNETESKTTA